MIIAFRYVMVKTKRLYEQVEELVSDRILVTRC